MKNVNCFKIIKDLFPLNRSLTGKPNLKTLKYLKKIVPKLKIKKFNSGEKYFDWKIPLEWNVKEAYIEDLCGKKVVDFKKNNLHLVGYSKPVNKVLKRKDLFKHLHTFKRSKKLIPYVTSYYKRYWGFCLSHDQKTKLKEPKYRVFINSSFKKGKMVYGEYYHRGKSEKEVLFSTYICHPSMANNELSGISVAINLAKWISKKKTSLSYRFIFVPETIGTIAYIKKNLSTLKKNTLAGYVVTCVGDKGKFSYMPSREGLTIADRVVKYVFKNEKINLKEYSFSERGSQEKHFCSPLVDLPVASVMRSKYGTYNEYHSSGDNLNFVSDKKLSESLNIYKKICTFFEKNKIFISSHYCEPMFSKRKIYPTLSFGGDASKKIKDIRNILMFSDGKRFLFEVSKIVKVNYKKCKLIVKYLKKTKLLNNIN